MQYSELKTAIQDYCQNSETTFVSHITDFIIAAEDKIFATISMPAFWKSDVDQVCIDGTSEYELDAGVLDIFSVRVSEGTTAQSSGVAFGPVRYLMRKDYDFMLEAYPGTASASEKGIPKYYAVSSSGVSSSDPTMTIRLGPIPDDVYPMTVDYYEKIAANSITNNSTDGNKTWLSVSFPDVLLYGALTQAYIFMKGEQDILQAYEMKFNEGLSLIKNLGEGRQVSDAYTDGTKSVPAQ